ncbi:MAG: protein-glutamate O-methyltransferase CheR [Spirochaetes bacterium]|nr:protein-glutamate O-methyltransferase CheR [Spirochaetota bacterium]
MITRAELSDADFDHFKAIIERESGIRFHSSKKILVEARLLRRMRELKIRAYPAYLKYLRDNYKDEIVNLINCVTTNKTEFFRESFHFQVLRDTVLPEFERRKKRRLRIWSAGCSTGEEPYTIAITLLEYYGDRCPGDTRILATDIDTSVLSCACEGIYSAQSVKCIEEPLLRRYFLRGRGPDEGRVKVKDSLKKMIRFRRLNLLSDSFPMSGPFDIIFCRNVVIYFDRESQVKLFTRFHHYLDNEGYLFMGHSEALTYMSDLFSLWGRSVYRKNRQCT